MCVKITNTIKLPNNQTALAFGNSSEFIEINSIKKPLKKRKNDITRMSFIIKGIKKN